MVLSDHGNYSGVVDIARNGIDEVIRLQTQAKQDTELIRQLVEALKVAVLQNNCNMVMTGEELRQSRSAIKVARARLESKP